MPHCRGPAPPPRGALLTAPALCRASPPRRAARTCAPAVQVGRGERPRPPLDGEAWARNTSAPAGTDADFSFNIPGIKQGLADIGHGMLDVAAGVKDCHLAELSSVLEKLALKLERQQSSRDKSLEQELDELLSEPRYGHCNPEIPPADRHRWRLDHDGR